MFWGRGNICSSSVWVPAWPSCSPGWLLSSVSWLTSRQNCLPRKTTGLAGAPSGGPFLWCVQLLQGLESTRCLVANGLRFCRAGRSLQFTHVSLSELLLSCLFLWMISKGTGEINGCEWLCPSSYSFVFTCDSDRLVWGLSFGNLFVLDNLRCDTLHDVGEKQDVISLCKNVASKVCGHFQIPLCIATPWASEKVTTYLLGVLWTY